MQRTDFAAMPCPIARALGRVGEWWSMLILRDALAGVTRFDAFQKRLGIAPNMLSRRLDALVEAGLMERRRYSERPPRDEYVLTPCGRDFQPVIHALLAWATGTSRRTDPTPSWPTPKPAAWPTRCWWTAGPAVRSTRGS